MVILEFVPLKYMKSIYINSISENSKVTMGKCAKRRQPPFSPHREVFPCRNMLGKVGLIKDQNSTAIRKGVYRERLQEMLQVLSEA